MTTTPERTPRGYIERLNAWLDAEERLATAERRRGLGILVATVHRFVVVEGLDLAGLVAMELFLTVIPITILGYAVFAKNRTSNSVGDLYVRQLHLQGTNAQLVLETFGDTGLLRTAFGNWQGLLGFLVWGIPMSLTVAKVFAKAWKLPEPGFVTQLWRGAVWFVLYLVTSFASDMFEMSARRLFHHGSPGAHGTAHDAASVAAGMSLGMVVATLPLVVLWAASHPLLVPGARWHWRTMVSIGLWGALLNGPLLRVAEVAAFPMLMGWWTGFGPMGVAMTLLTWSLVQGVGWVLAACLGAVIVERRRTLGPDGNLLPLEEALAERSVREHP